MRAGCAARYRAPCRPAARVREPALVLLCSRLLSPGCLFVVSSVLLCSDGNEDFTLVERNSFGNSVFLSPLPPAYLYPKTFPPSFLLTRCSNSSFTGISVIFCHLPLLALPSCSPCPSLLLVGAGVHLVRSELLIGETPCAFLFYGEGGGPEVLS